GPGRSTGKTGRDHRLAERLQRPRDVDSLATRHRPLLAGAVPAADLEVRHGQRLVDGRVEGDCDDHPVGSWGPSGAPRRRYLYKHGGRTGATRRQGTTPVYP